MQALAAAELLEDGRMGARTVLRVGELELHEALDGSADADERHGLAGLVEHEG